MDLKLGALIPQDALNKLYDDAVSPVAKQVGKLGEDAMKTARLVLFPLQLASGAQSRLEAMIERLSKRVPSERRVEPPAAIVVPVIEHLQYATGEDELSAMFEEILAKAIDSEFSDVVHPAFPALLKQLSRDEAWILYRLRDVGFNVIYKMTLISTTNKLTDRVIEASELPTDELYGFNQIDLYYVHLQSLGLVEWPILDQIPIIENNRQVGLRHYTTMQLTELGKLFVAAVIPTEGFERFKKPARSE